MALKVHYSGNSQLLEGRKIAVIGYGSQGHAHALNLKESGFDVVVGLRENSASAEAARAQGLTVMGVEEAAEAGSIVMLLIPDQHQKLVYESQIKKYINPGKALAFGHGFNVHYGWIVPPEGVDVFMVAPKSPGHLVRRTYQEGRGVPCLVAVAQDASGTAMDLAIAYAAGIGGDTAGIIETTFRDETETDLFGEQAVLCGGSEGLIRAGFETLTEAGYPPELAYFEVLHELKLIVDLYYEGGLAYMNYSISDTAEYGNYSRGARIVNDSVKQEMKKVLSEIQSGEFAREWIAECEAGWPNMDRLRKESREHPIEVIGKKLRSMMSWIRNSESQKGEDEMSATEAAEVV